MRGQLRIEDGALKGVISDFYEAQKASERRGQRRAPITLEELRPYNREIDPDTFVPLDARLVLLTFIGEGDVDNVTRMLSFTDICTPAFLNTVDVTGGFHHRAQHATFLMAALWALAVPVSTRLDMLDLLTEGGCTAWNGAFNFAGTFSPSAFQMLFRPDCMADAHDHRHRAIIQTALRAGAHAHVRVSAMGKTAYEQAYESFPQLLSELPPILRDASGNPLDRFSRMA